MWNFKQHSPSPGNLTKVYPKPPLKSMANFIYQIWKGGTSWNFTNCFKCENKYIADKNIWWDYCHSIYSFIKFKVLVSLPKSFHCPFNYENALQLVYWAYYWSQFNWVKQADNTSVHWVLTCLLFVSEQMTLPSKLA